MFLTKSLNLTRYLIGTGMTVVLMVQIQDRNRSGIAAMGCDRAVYTVLFFLSWAWKMDETPGIMKTATEPLLDCKEVQTSV